MVFKKRKLKKYAWIEVAKFPYRNEIIKTIQDKLK
jgi:hypothetical protein